MHTVNFIKHAYIVQNLGSKKNICELLTEIKICNKNV